MGKYVLIQSKDTLETLVAKISFEIKISQKLIWVYDSIALVAHLFTKRCTTLCVYKVIKLCMN